MKKQRNQNETGREKIRFLRFSIYSLILLYGLFGETACNLLQSEGLKPSRTQPIARWDVVPFQRIDSNEVFNAGVVAFSKSGIESVVFQVSGGGYHGLNPLISTSMSFNPRTGVHEYWVPIDPEDFSNNGPFSISADVSSKDGTKRDLGELPMVVDADGTLNQPEAWVSETGSDATGEVGNSAEPFLTIGGAINAIQQANGGLADGAVVYLFEGDYDLSGGLADTDSEWVTITRDESASKSNTRITGDGLVTDTKLLRFTDLTIEAENAGDMYFITNPRRLWVDDCIVQGAGRYIHQSNPIYRSEAEDDGYRTYITDTEISDVSYGMHRGTMARGVSMDRIGNDAYVNVEVIINAVVNDVDPGLTYWHADAYQSWGTEPSNRIIYGFYATDLHCQGLFLSFDKYKYANNNAFVNVFIEMREPGSPGFEGGEPVLDSGAFYGLWNHLIMWNCTFIGGNFYVAGNNKSEFILTNSSFVGNTFHQYIDSDSVIAENPDYALPDNDSGNEFLYNNYHWSAVYSGGGGPEEPHWYSKSPDTSLEGTSVVGDPELDSYGYPAIGSPLIDIMPNAYVPSDALGNLRDSSPDIGALENH